MDSTKHPGFSRRKAIAIGAGAAALAVGASLPKPAATLAAVRSGNGVAGGGTVKVGDGTAHFSLFAARFQVTGKDDFAVTAHVHWVDTHAGINLISTEIKSYGKFDGGMETAREIKGLALINGRGSHPFTLRLLDAGQPGSGKDQITLTIEPDQGTPPTAAGVYQADGPLTAGDVELITLDIPA